MALVIRGGTIEGKALDLAADLLKQGRISRAEAQVIQDLAEVAAKRLSPADRATPEEYLPGRATDDPKPPPCEPPTDRYLTHR